MKRFAAITLLITVVTNCAVGYCLQIMADAERREHFRHGWVFVGGVLIALAIPPWLYALAVLGAAIFIAGAFNKVGERTMLISSFTLLLLAVACLVVTLWGYQCKYPSPVILDNSKN